MRCLHFRLAYQLDVLLTLLGLMPALLLLLERRFTVIGYQPITAILLIVEWCAISQIALMSTHRF